MKASPGRRPGSIPDRCGSVSQREAEFQAIARGGERFRGPKGDVLLGIHAQAVDFILRLVLPDRPDNDVGNPEGESAYANNRAYGRDAEPCADFGFLLRARCRTRIRRHPDGDGIHDIENIGAEERYASAESESRAQGFLVLGILEVFLQRVLGVLRGAKRDG
jgi:hypothetical protein